MLIGCYLFLFFLMQVKTGVAVGILMQLTICPFYHVGFQMIKSESVLIVLVFMLSLSAAYTTLNMAPQTGVLYISSVMYKNGCLEFLLITLAQTKQAVK